MIITFYDQNFKGLQNNASLVVDNTGYSLIKRGIEFDTFTCSCEAFTENILPCFVAVKDNYGRYVYGALAGIPERGNDNKTKINASDLKSLLSCDIELQTYEYKYVNSFFEDVFDSYKSQVAGFNVELVFVEEVPFAELKQAEGYNIYNAWELLQSYLKYYNLFMTTKIDFINRKVVYTVRKSMVVENNIRIWEYDGATTYGKWIASVNETCSIVMRDGAVAKKSTPWILTSQSKITQNAEMRDIYPVKRKIIIKTANTEEDITKIYAEAEEEALSILCGSMFNENLELPLTNVDFRSKCNVYLQRGEKTILTLPVGEMHYDIDGLKKVQLGYRFLGLDFIK